MRDEVGPEFVVPTFRLLAELIPFICSPNLLAPFDCVWRGCRKSVHESVLEDDVTRGVRFSRSPLSMGGES